MSGEERKGRGWERGGGRIKEWKGARSRCSFSTSSSGLSRSLPGEHRGGGEGAGSETRGEKTGKKKRAKRDNAKRGALEVEREPPSLLLRESDLPLFQRSIWRLSSGGDAFQLPFAVRETTQRVPTRRAASLERRRRKASSIYLAATRGTAAFALALLLLLLDLSAKLPPFFIGDFFIATRAPFPLALPNLSHLGCTNVTVTVPQCTRRKCREKKGGRGTGNRDRASCLLPPQVSDSEERPEAAAAAKISFSNSLPAACRRRRGRRPASPWPGPSRRERRRRPSRPAPCRRPGG